MFATAVINVVGLTPALVGSDTPLTVLPGGSTNVYCRTLGIPEDVVDATEYLLRMADQFEPRRVDVGRVNGRAFGSATPAFFSGRRASVAATTDYAEDPVDVYRVKLGAHRRLRLKLEARVGNPDLFVFAASARSVRNSRSLRSSTRSGRATERLTISNRRGRTRTFYVTVGFRAGRTPRLFNAAYVLRAR